LVFGLFGAFSFFAVGRIEHRDARTSIEERGVLSARIDHGVTYAQYTKGAEGDRVRFDRRISRSLPSDRGRGWKANFVTKKTDLIWDPLNPAAADPPRARAALRCHQRD